MHFLFAFADSQQEWNCSQWRALSPSNALNASGKHTAQCLFLPALTDYLSAGTQEIVGKTDVIFVQRNLVHPAVWSFCRYWGGMGKIIVADLDDAYQIMPRSNPAHAFWAENSAKLEMDPVKALEKGLGYVDGLTAPSKRLLEDWEHVVPTYWLPNWATGAWYKNRPKRKEDGTIIIGWGGSVSHYDSWWGSGIKGALAGICAEFPHVKVKVCGNDPRVFEQLPVPAGQKIKQTGVKPEDWPAQVASFDIGVAPLSGEYDQRRSWIKALEYMLVGIPWVGTEGRPYEDLKQYGTLVGEGSNEWYKAVREIVAHYDDHLALARENQNVGWENTLERRIDDYAKTFRKIGAARRDYRLPGIHYLTGDAAKRGGGTTGSSNAMGA